MKSKQLYRNILNLDTKSLLVFMSFFMNIPSTDIRIVGKEISNGDLYIEIMGVYNLVNYGRIYIDNEYDVIFGDHINKTNHLIKITKIIDIVRQISLHKLLNE